MNIKCVNLNTIIQSGINSAICKIHKKILPAIAAATGEADEAVAPFEAACESSPIIASSNANSPLRNNSSSFFSTSVDNLLFFINIFFFKRSGDGSWTPGCN